MILQVSRVRLLPQMRTLRLRGADDLLKGPTANSRRTLEFVGARRTASEQAGLALPPPCPSVGQNQISPTDTHGGSCSGCGWERGRGSPGTTHQQVAEGRCPPGPAAPDANCSFPYVTGAWQRHNDRFKI